MSPRALKIALAVSVGLNVFVLGAVAGGLIIGGKMLAERRPEGRPPVTALVGSLDEPTRERVEDQLRQSALAARGDFETAREARREAVRLAGQETFDRSAVQAALDRSHTAEAAGRRRLEGTVLDVMGDMQAEDRRVFAPALSRRGHERGGRDRRERRRSGPREAPPAS